MWYIFPKSKKTILENQRVMRLKAASWVEDTQGASCSYSVVCADGSIVTEGFLDFEIQKVAYAYLIGLNPGSYTLIVDYGDYEYHGVIEL